jgi:response regulator RpfG family c-di-GMP phosphodiesterase
MTEEPEKEEGAAGEEETLEAVEVPKKRIVIIDSTEKTLDEAISALRKGEYTVIGAETTEEFFEVTKWKKATEKEGDSGIKAVTPDHYWEITKGNVPDLLITDLEIKDMDGWELIFSIKFDNRNYEYWNLPIMVRTEQPITIETAKKFQAESIYDYFPKTLKGKDLLKKIDNLFITKEKLSETKKKIAENLSYTAAKEYERIFLATRIRLKYLHALKTMLNALKEGGGDAQEIRNIQEMVFLQNRDVIKYERRKREIKRKLKEAEVKKDDGGAENKPGVKAETD